MNKERLLTIVKDPAKMTMEDKQTLSDMIATYPYFHTAHMLLLLNSKQFKDDKFETSLRESALFVSDRKILFNFLSEKKTISSESPQKIEETPAQNSEVTPAYNGDLLEIDENLQESNGDKPKVIEFEVSNSSREEMNEPGFELEEGEIEQGDSPELDLIQKFIQENPAFTPNKLDMNEERKDISQNSIKEDDDLATETMAVVYAGQKLYDKAIAIYEKLILKFPEKKAYFAGRINELKENLKNS